MKTTISIFCALLFVFSMASANDLDQIHFLYQPLANRLLQDGFDLEFLSKLLADDRAEPILSRMTLSLDSSEMPEIYKKFLRPEWILPAKKFLHQNLKMLSGMEKKFGVDKEVVVAILLVESKFGEYTGQHRVLPTLASMAVLDSPENLWSNYLMLQVVDPELFYERLEGLAKRKADWAYHELKCFLKIVRHERIDPLEVRGSYAGAVGMAQFIPSSYLAYCQRKKSFEKWLLDKEEAIVSIANYLRSHGWKRNLPPEKKRQVVWYYNHSDPYVDTVLQVAQKIKRK